MSTDEQIQNLKSRLIAVAEQHNYNFQHPAVLKLSVELDQLILLRMTGSPAYACVG